MRNNIPNDFIDLVLTSPPYDNLRNYSKKKKTDKNVFNFESVAQELERILKPGGIIVWVVGDATIKGSETGTSFRQALYFKDKLGLNLHDTMIFHKETPTWNITCKRYRQHIEYMFVFSKGKPKTFNPIEDVPVKNMQPRLCKSNRNNLKPHYELYVPKKKFTVRGNIWKYSVGSSSASNKIAFKHPAIFPEQLAIDHIKTWTNPGDIVFDPMAGSGTVGFVALQLSRNYILCEREKEYVANINKRLK